MWLPVILVVWFLIGGAVALVVGPALKKLGE
jgi:hypothetical protein